MKKAGMAVIAGTLAALFAGTAAAQEPVNQQWGIWGLEHEEQMRGDIKAFTDFMLEEAYPAIYGDGHRKAMAGNDAAIQNLYEVRGRRYELFARLLDGCYGAPGLADYAWAANYMAQLNWTGNEEDHLERHEPELYETYKILDLLQK